MGANPEPYTPGCPQELAAGRVPQNVPCRSDGYLTPTAGRGAYRSTGHRHFAGQTALPLGHPRSFLRNRCSERVCPTGGIIAGWCCQDGQNTAATRLSTRETTAGRWR